MIFHSLFISFIVCCVNNINKRPNGCTALCECSIELPLCELYSALPLLSLSFNASFTIAAIQWHTIKHCKMKSTSHTHTMCALSTLTTQNDLFLLRIVRNVSHRPFD